VVLLLDSHYYFFPAGEGSISGSGLFLYLYFLVATRMGDDAELPGSEAAKDHFVWQYFTVTNNDPKKGGAKNALCMFCDKNFSGCSTSRAAAHLLARPVMGQDKAGVKPCIAINKKDDDRRGALRNAQRAIGKVIRDKEQSVAGKKRKQQVMDDLITSPTKQSVESSLIGSQKSGTNEVDAMITNEVDAMIASFFYENGISFNVANSSSFGRMIAESMKFAKQNRVLSQVISASSCERNWSAHGHIHSKIRNRLEPATTEKLVYVYSNSKMVAATSDADQLKMFARDNEDV
jgi:hypothetical protein